VLPRIHDALHFSEGYAASEGFTEENRLRQRELDLLEERRMLRAEVAELRADRDRLRSTDHIKALQQRAEAAEYNFGLEHDALVVAEAEVKKLRDDASVWSSNYQDVAAKLRDTYCARCHERMYP
jgi:small-conductance mechanosensitive channel